MPAGRDCVRLSLRLLTAARLIERRIDRLMRAEFKSTISRFDFLSALDRHGPLTLGEISENLLVSNGNVTGLAARLKADGMILAQPHESDRRIQRVALTPQGLRTFARMASAHAACIDTLLAAMPAPDRRTLMRLIDVAKDSIRRTLDEEAAA